MKKRTFFVSAVFWTPNKQKVILTFRSFKVFGADACNFTHLLQPLLFAIHTVWIKYVFYLYREGAVKMRKITETIIRKFEAYLTDEEKSPATLEKYIRDVSAFAAWCDGRDICKGLVMEYKRGLTERYAPASVNSILSSLNSFFGYLEWYDCKVKTLRIQRQLFSGEDRLLSKAEYERLLTVAKKKGNQKLYLLMQTICSTGIRVSELKYITIETLQKRKATINMKGKSRVIILPDPLCRTLLAYAKKQRLTRGAVFVSRTGKPMNRSNIWRLMKNLCESANVKKEKVFPHALRHLFARTYYSLQKDVVRLADILGHTSVNTTRIYTMETGEVHRKQIEKLGLLRC